MVRSPSGLHEETTSLVMEGYAGLPVVTLITLVIQEDDGTVATVSVPNEQSRNMFRA